MFQETNNNTNYNKNTFLRAIERNSSEKYSNIKFCLTLNYLNVKFAFALIKTNIFKVVPKEEAFKLVCCIP